MGSIRVINAESGKTNVFVHLDVVYATREGQDLCLQIIQPSGDAVTEGWEAAFSRTYPCIAFVQGSGWREQDLGAGMSFWCRFAERGYVVAIVQYRPSSIAAHPAQVYDAKMAVRWLRRHADRYGIDPGQITIAGDSSGGHTALLAHATDGTHLLDDDPAPEPLNLAGAVALYPPTDLAQLENDDAVRDLLGGIRPSQNPELTRDATPSHYLRGRDVGPVLLVHGTRDDVIPYQQSIGYAQALRDDGQHCELVLVDGAGHGIWPSLYTSELADIVDEFLTRARIHHST